MPEQNPSPAETTLPEATVDPLDVAHFQAGNYDRLRRDPSRSIEQHTKDQAQFTVLTKAVTILDQHSGEDRVAGIRAEIDQLPLGLTDQNPQKRALHSALFFAEKDWSGLKRNKAFTSWLEQRQAQESVISQTELDEARRKSSAGAARAAAEARGKLEDIHREQLVQDVLNSSGATFHTDLPKDLSQTGYDAGFSSIINGLNGSGKELSEQVSTAFALLGDENGRYGREEATYLKNGVQEAITFRPLTQPIYGKVDTKVRGKLGIKRTEPQLQAIDRSAVTVGEVLEDPATVGERQVEPAVMMVYQTFGNPDYTQADTRFLAHDGRDGNIVRVSVVMPQSVAEQLQRAGVEDPNIIRNLIDKIALQKAGIPAEAWYKGNDQTNGRKRRPPHEAWEEYHGQSKMYFKEPGDQTFDPAKAIVFTGAKR